MPPLSSASPLRPRPRLRDLTPGSVGRIAVTLACIPLVRFAAVGSVGLAVDASAFRALTVLAFSDAAARALSLACATFVTWRLNRAVTFRPSGRAQAVESSRYGAVALAAQGFNYALFLSLRLCFPHLHDLVALVLSAGAAACFSFTGHRFFTFSPGARPRAIGEPLLASELPR